MGLDYAILFRLMESSGAIILLLRSLPVALPQPATTAGASLFIHRMRRGWLRFPSPSTDSRKTNLGAGDGNPFHPGAPAPSFKAGRPR